MEVVQVPDKKSLFFAVCVSVCLACAPERPSDRALGQGEEEARKTTSTDATTSEADRRPVAIIDGEEITVADFERRIDGMAPYARVRYNTMEKRQELLNTMIAFELLARDAKQKGYQDDPAVLHAMKDTMVRRMLEDELRRRVSISDISQGDVERVYREKAKNFERPEQRRVASIAVDSREVMDELLSRYAEVKDAPVKERVQTFRVLASRYHRIADVASKGGDEGFFPPPDDLEPELADRRHLAAHVFALSAVGDISEPYERDGVWYVVLFLDEKQSSKRSISESTSELRQYLYDKRRHEAREALIEELKKGAKVEVNQGVLESIPTPAEHEGLRLEDLNYGSTPVRDLKRTAP